MFIRVFDCVQAVYDPWLLIGAILVSLLSGFALFTVLHHAGVQENYARQGWQFAGAFVAGGGIWSAHFVAMLGFHPAAAVSYDVFPTIASCAVAILVVGVAIPFLLSRSTLGALTGGVILGAAIGAAHFIGMKALVFGGTISWDLPMVMLSLTCGAGLTSTSALIARDNNRCRDRLAAGGLFGGAICAIHFIAMRAAALQIDPTSSFSNGRFSETLLGLSVAFSTSLIVVLSLALVVFDRRAHYASTDARQTRSIIEMVQTGILVCQGTKVIEANQTFARLIGMRQSEIAGRSFEDFIALPFSNEDPWPQGVREAEAFLTTAMKTQFEVELIATPITSGTESRLLIEVRDVRLQKQERDHITYLANHDSLTGLANRRLFRAELQRAVENAAGSDREFGLLWIDLDHFKEVNDIHGHAVGDDVLCITANRFRSALGGVDQLVARIGGDEFVVLTRDNPRVVAQGLVEAMSKPISIGDCQLDVGLSIGLASYPRDANSADALMRLADQALYDAKKAGRGRWSSRAA
ncbi:diguanylate cyclase [Rhizobium sp. 2YAF20]|uniref:sensor domain-containing diguanylate cyclase n=1 Tax=Rhizobium sp. 2YAF20 TaxID=3233027 RepID=UPI003F9CE31B